VRKVLPETMFSDVDRSRLSMLRSWVLEHKVTEIEMSEHQFWNLPSCPRLPKKAWSTFMGRMIRVADMPVDAQKQLGIFDKPAMAADAWSKIRRYEFIGPFSLPRVRGLGCCIDFCSVCVESEKQAGLVARQVRLQSLERFLRYEERPLHRAVVTPEPNGASGRIKNAAWVRKVEHGLLGVLSVSTRNPAFSQTFGIPRPPIISFRIVSGYPKTLQMSLDRSQGLVARGVFVTHLRSRAGDVTL
jgi:hypothetical protein